MPFPAGLSPFAVAVAGFNGDGRIDAADLAGFRLNRIESRLVS